MFLFLHLKQILEMILIILLTQERDKKIIEKMNSKIQVKNLIENLQHCQQQSIQ